MKIKDQHFKVEEWNGYDIYVDGQGVFFVLADDRRHGEDSRAAQAKSIDALKAGLSVGRDVSVPAYRTPRYNSDGALDRVVVVRVTGLNNLMVRSEARPDLKPEKVSKFETLLVRDDARAAKRRELLAQAKAANAALAKLMDDWPTVAAKDIPA